MRKKTQQKKRTNWRVDTINLGEHINCPLPPLMRDENFFRILDIYTLDLFTAKTNKITYKEIKAIIKSLKKIEDKEVRS